MLGRRLHNLGAAGAAELQATTTDSGLCCQNSSMGAGQRWAADLGANLLGEKGDTAVQLNNNFVLPFNITVSTSSGQPAASAMINIWPLACRGDTSWW